MLDDFEEIIDQFVEKTNNIEGMAVYKLTKMLADILEQKHEFSQVSAGRIATSCKFVISDEDVFNDNVEQFERIIEKIAQMICNFWIAYEGDFNIGLDHFCKVVMKDFEFTVG